MKTKSSPKGTLNSPEYKRRNRRDKEQFTYFNGLSKAQLGRMVAFFKDIDYESMPWWTVQAKLMDKVKTLPNNIDTSTSFATYADAVAFLKKIAEELATLSKVVADHPHESDDKDYLWAVKMSVEGALNDKLGGLAGMIMLCPCIHTREFETLKAHLNSKNRTEKEIAVSNCTNLWFGKNFIPKSRGFHPLTKPIFCEKNQTAILSTLPSLFIEKQDGNYYLNRLNPFESDGPVLRLLLTMYFEEQASAFCASVLATIKELLNDNVEFMRRRCYESLATMSYGNEQVTTILRLMAYGIGDPVPKLGGFVSLKLGQIMLKRPSLKAEVCTHIEECIWMVQVDSISIALRHDRKSEGASFLRLYRKAKDGKLSMKRVLKSQGIEINSNEISSSSFKNSHGRVTAYLTALADVAFATKGEEILLTEQLHRYVRLLKVAAEKPDSMAMLKIQKQRARMSKRIKKETSFEESDLESMKQLLSSKKVMYIKGIAHCKLGSPVLRAIFNGIRRMLPFCNQEILNSSNFLKACEVDSTRNTAPGVLLSNVVLALCNSVGSATTRIQGWSLLFDLSKKLYDGVPPSIIANIYDNLRDIHIIQARNVSGWYRFMESIIADLTINVEVRSAFVRSCFGLALIGTHDNLVLAMIQMLDHVCRNDESTLSDWISEAFGSQKHLVDQIADFQENQYNPAKANSMSSRFFEISLADIHVSSLVKDGAAAMRAQFMDAYEDSNSESDVPESNEEEDVALTWPALTGWKFVQDKLIELNSKTASAKYMQALQASSCGTTLYKMLSGVGLFHALTGVNPKIESMEDDDFEAIMWTANVRTKAFWNAVDQLNFNFPFRSVIEPAIRANALESVAPLDIEQEADRLADRFVGFESDEDEELEDDVDDREADLVNPSDSDGAADLEDISDLEGEATAYLSDSE